MNKGVEKLYAISRKPLRRIIGLMSGTSLDGLDIALCDITGSGMATRVTIPFFETVPYPAAVKEEIRKVFAKDTVDFRHLCLLNPWLGRLHAGWILECLQKWEVSPAAVDLVASHGQTVYHSPRILHRLEAFPDATLQIGDGDHIAAGTGIITVSDFRQKHIAAGGEGAPLALYGDYLIFSKPGEDRLMLNMGGIANFTYLPGEQDPRLVFVTDTGPGNTLIDAYAQRHFQQDFDRDALLARQGTVNAALLQALKANDFFSTGFPKTTGPELFNAGYVEQAQVASHTTTISAFDIMATLTRFSAETIADAIRVV
ncbi:MAG TPA: anhydro-N-acetylmuramic acid kinase, partial [Chitinophagaceae bacterium]|nr:anhydro-N-acetylmuramic acid kinase [Chitinophagaceae bacterium]